METIADQKITSAKAHLKETIKELASIIIDECQGHDEFIDTYRNDIKKALIVLIDVSEGLGE